jgi:hypothetical protein
VWQDNPAVAVHLVVHMHILPQHCHVLHTRPLTNGRVPPDDAPSDARMLLHAHPSQDGAAGQAHTRLDIAARSNGHVRADKAALPNLGSRVDQDVPGDVRPACQPLREPSAQRLEIELQTRDVVLWLPDVHPEPRKLHTEELAISCHLWEDLLLNGGRPQLNPVEDLRVADVDAGVDLVADEDLRLLDKAVDVAGLLVVDDDAVFRGFFDLQSEHRV